MKAKRTRTGKKSKTRRQPIRRAPSKTSGPKALPAATKRPHKKKTAAKRKRARRKQTTALTVPSIAEAPGVSAPQTPTVPLALALSAENAEAGASPPAPQTQKPAAPAANPITELAPREIRPPGLPAQSAPPPFPIPPILLEGDEPSVPPRGRESSKGEAPATPVWARLEEVESELPESYGTGRLMLTPRDPHCLYAHWDLTLEQQRICNSLSLHQHLVVRLYLDRQSGQPVHEIHVHPESRNWFIHIEQAGRTYVAELGYYQREGQFRVAAVSDPATTPSEGPAEQAPVEFATLSFTPREPATPRVPLPVVREVAPPQPVTAAAPARVEVKPEPRSERPEPQQPQQTPAAFNLPQTGQGVVENNNGTQYQPSPPGLTAPAAPAASVEWTPAQERALAEIIHASFSKRDWLGSAEIMALIEGRLEQPVSSLPPEQAPPLLAGISSLAGAEAAPVSSPTGQPVPPPVSFWFNVNAELVIYGATEPDARVTIGGRVIRLRRDGSFSYRFALPDGYYRLPIEAVAAHGDARQADLEFFRRTRYRGEVGSHPQDPALKAPHVENVA